MIVQGSLDVPKADDRRGQLAKAAQQFEAIFVRQMLAAARQSSLADGLFDNSSVKQFQSMQDAQFADLVAQQGGLGLGKTIEQQLAAQMEGSIK